MKIVFAAAEAAPFIKTGGLGDVAEALPGALSKIKDNEIYLFLPYYSKIKYNENIKTEFLTSFSVDLSWRKQHCGVFKYKSRKTKLQVFFIDNEYYFNRALVYGEPDDGERFAFFSKAILESVKRLKLNPDIIHCNDWQTALVPVFLHAFYHKELGKAKTVFTIHNIEYQGKCDPYFIGDTLGLYPEYESTLMYDNCVNFLKAAVLKSDAVTTVSETYMKELSYPYYSHGLSDVINEHLFKSQGIVNGINTEMFSPKNDTAIYYNYDKENVNEGKAKNKAELQKELGLPQKPDAAVIGMVSRLVSHKGLDLIVAKLEELLQGNVQLVILGTGDKKHEEALKKIAKKYKDKMSLNLMFDLKLASKIYAASDLYLMPSKSEPCGLSQLIAMSYGTIPVVNAVGGLKDTVEPFNIETKKGTGFNFQSYNADDMLGAINRALDIFFNNKPLFNQIIENALSGDYSWKKPAKKYMNLYCKISKIK